MKERISDCSTKLTGLLMGLVMLLGLTAPLSAQSTYCNRPTGNRTVTKQKKKKEKKPSEIEYPLFNGVNVGVDLWGLGGKLFGSDFVSSEVAVDVDLKHRFFPVMELGYGSTDSWNEKGTHYKSNAPYVRIGMDYNSLGAAIFNGDTRLLTKVKGLGKKTAERIVLELKEKVVVDSVYINAGQQSFDFAIERTDKLSPDAEKAVAILCSLGKTPADAEKLVQAVVKLGATTTEEIVNMSFRM